MIKTPPCIFITQSTSCFIISLSVAKKEFDMKKLLKTVIAATVMLAATFTATAAKSGRVITRDSAKSKSAAASSKRSGARALEIKVSMAHNQTALDNPYVFGANAFKQKIEQVSSGGATADLYNGTMSEDEGELLKKLQNGEVNIVVVSPGLLTGLGVTEADMFSLEYLFDNFAHWGKTLDGQFGSELAKIVSQKTNSKIQVLGYWSAGVRDYYGKKPIHSPSDLKGMTIRIGSSPVQRQFWSACGATPVTVGWGALYDALNTGKVDSAENDYTNMSLKDHHKAKNGKYICETEHEFTTRLMLVNGDFYNKLTAEQKKWIDDAARYSTQVERQKTFEQASSSKAKVIREGATVVDNKDIDIAAFKKIAIPIQDEYAKKNGLERFLQMARGN